MSSEPYFDPTFEAPSTTKDLVTEGVTWGWRDVCIGLMLAAIAFFVGLLAVSAPFLLIWGENDPIGLAGSALGQIGGYAAAIFVIYLLVRRKGGDWSDLGWRRRRDDLRVVNRPPVSVGFGRLFGDSLNVRVPWLIFAVVTGYLTAIGAVLLYSIIVNALGIDALQPGQQVPDQYFDHKWVLFVLGLPVVIGAPLAEETFFRGFLFGGLKRSLHPEKLGTLTFLPAALISGFIFSLAHIDVGLIIPFTIVGMVLANTYQATGTLYASMGVHFIFNLVSFTALVLTS